MDDGDLEDIFDQSDESEVKHLAGQFKRRVESWQKTGYREALVETDSDEQSQSLQAAFDTGYATANQLVRRLSQHRTSVALIYQLYQNKVLEGPNDYHQSALEKLQSISHEWEKVIGHLHQYVLGIEDKHMSDVTPETASSSCDIVKVQFLKSVKTVFSEEDLIARTNLVLCELRCPLKIT